ncbi:MAG: TIGR00159 family protein [Ruminococcaceae bacterium]|nr:TIGR00159 family protein [Oscillospiraceae bacterium]
MSYYLSFSSSLNEIKNALLNFNGISDILDILLVAFIIYAGIKLIRDTKAIQLAKGFILILILYAAVNIFNMEASSYLFSMIFSNLLLVLVIIFSPEIRHALESVGRSSVSNFSLFSFKNSDLILKQDLSNTMINAVCRSCSEMSDEKIGALIVLEKETLLGQIIETGTKIDAEISPEILGNIFFPKAPLHDGAAIIRNFRVCAAGCILPLTKNNDISSSLGTRHRAAIGMSEQSDAIVIVVSEETGAISVAEKGNLRRNISDGDLREILSNSFSYEDTDKGFFKKIRRDK